MDWEPTGSLLADLQGAIEHGNPMQVHYTDKKGQTSERKALPLEIRGDKVYVADLDKMALRLFMLSSIGEYQVLDEYVNKDELSLNTH